MRVFFCVFPDNRLYIEDEVCARVYPSKYGVWIVECISIYTSMDTHKMRATVAVAAAAVLLYVRCASKIGFLHLHNWTEHNMDTSTHTNTCMSILLTDFFTWTTQHGCSMDLFWLFRFIQQHSLSLFHSLPLSVALPLALSFVPFAPMCSSFLIVFQTF